MWNKKPADIIPKGLVSNFTNYKCYCSSTNNCDSKITKEHYISKNILLYINNNTKSATIAGLPWIPNNDSKNISIDSLTTKTLCERHNNSFSPLDAEASKLFTTIGEYDTSFLNAGNKDAISVLCGEDIEKWMLKTVCGFVSAKQIDHDKKVKNTQIKQLWIDILDGKKDWPKHWGLYISVQTDIEVLHKAQTFAFIPRINPENDDLLVAEILINNITFILLLGTPDTPDSFGIYRPRTLIFHDNNVKKYIELSWQDNSYSKYISFTRTGTQPPEDNNNGYQYN